MEEDGVGASDIKAVFGERMMEALARTLVGESSFWPGDCMGALTTGLIVRLE